MIRLLILLVCIAGAVGALIAIARVSIHYIGG